MDIVNVTPFTKPREIAKRAFQFNGLKGWMGKCTKMYQNLLE